MDKSYSIKNPDFGARVQASLASQAFMHQLLGARATQITPGFVEIALDARPALLQPGGHVHGSVLAALADSATGYAAQTLLPVELDIVTVEFKINFLAPGFGTHYLARGRVIRAGRTLFVCAGDLFAVQGADETLVAHMVTTMMAVPSHG
jgi:uncharacterized protein (TIGR00369 family)